MEKKNIYDEPSKKDVERIHQQNYDLRKQMKEERKNPYKGNVIKAGTYNYNAKQTQKDNDVDDAKHQDNVESQSYEDKVNEILESTNIQEEINNILSQKKADEERVKKILEKNDNQSRVKRIIDRDER